MIEECWTGGFRDTSSLRQALEAAFEAQLLAIPEQ